MIYNASYGFSWGRLCLPLFFTALWLWLRGRSGWALAMVVWAVLIKEEAAVYLGMFGFYLAFFRKQRWVGLTLGIGSFAYFWIITAVIIPLFSGHGYGVVVRLCRIGKRTHGDSLVTADKASTILGSAVRHAELLFAWVLAGPLAAGALRKPSVLFIASLPFLFICLWNNPNVKSICFQYQLV